MQKCSLFFPNRLNKRDSFSSASEPQPSPLWIPTAFGFQISCRMRILVFPLKHCGMVSDFSHFEVFFLLGSRFVGWAFFHHYSKLQKNSSCCSEGLFFLLKTLKSPSKVYDFPHHLHSFYQPLLIRHQLTGSLNLLSYSD